MKKLRSFSKLVELIRSDKVYSYGYNIDFLESSVCFSNDCDLIGKPLIEDISKLTQIYSNIAYYCTIKRGRLVLCVYLM